jgi:hypothetical protein
MTDVIRYGAPTYYGPQWPKARQLAIDRSGGICERCHKNPIDDVHHALPVRYFIEVSDAHFLSNLIAVCLRCHQDEHRLLSQSLPLLDRLQAALTEDNLMAFKVKPKLLETIDAHWHDRKYKNRAETVKALIRDGLRARGVTVPPDA